MPTNDSVYEHLQSKMVLLTLLVSFTPLFLLGVIIYHQFAQMYKNKVEEQIRYRANAHTEAIDIFLKERVASLGTVADTHKYAEMVDEEKLSVIFKAMNSWQGAFVDLGVIDNSGQQQAYIGPYDLKGLNYAEQPWFAEVMSKGMFISDVYMGFRQVPHFIIAVRRQESYKIWILRATIDLEQFGGFVRSAHIGRSGDAYLINSNGIYQTRPRFTGDIMNQSSLDTTLFGARTTVTEKETKLIAGARLKRIGWILIISQDISEEMTSLFKTRAIEIIIITFGVLAIIFTTFFTTRMAINRLKENEYRINELHVQLMQSDKLAALGKMAAGVAHEINNPLAVILQKTGWMEDLLVEEEFQTSENLKEYKTSLQKIEEHVERARKVVHNMLGYARKMEPRLDEVNINQMLDQTIDLLENYARINNIGIQTNFDPTVPTTSSDQAQLQQVFLNLINNAIDAIGKDGSIEIKTKTSKNMIDILVSDNGPGISEENLKKVFDPFFTTKEIGKGTGLGLWVSYDIVTKMGGSLNVHSKIGEGTTFTVSIPIIKPEKS